MHLIDGFMLHEITVLYGWNFFQIALLLFNTVQRDHFFHGNALHQVYYALRLHYAFQHRWLFEHHPHDGQGWHEVQQK